VAEQPDRRFRSDLDLFVLALIDNGISTPYDLKNAAGLSPGATIPALRRLIERGLALQTRAGPRGRREHRITAAGRQFLNTGWRPLIEEGPSGELDADLRVALLALIVGGDRPAATTFLRNSAVRNLESTRDSEDLEIDSLPPLASWYRKLRMSAAESLRRGQSAAALAMAKRLPHSPHPNRSRRRGKTRN
jgi:DNA-binding PadR family transcriptional regulator